MLHHYFATCIGGLEATLARELGRGRIGARDIEVGSSGVHFRGDFAVGMRACLHLRTAIRVLAEIAQAEVRDSDQLYEWGRSFHWHRMMRINHTFSVDCRVRDSGITHSKYGALRIKDAICDHFREATGERPNVNVEQADLPLFLYIWRNQATLYRDLSGVTLHKRGYRGAMHKSALNETVAAGMLLMAGYDGEGDLLDPMCGAGTFAIEAALIALERAPGLLRKHPFPFEGWPEFNAPLYREIRREAEAAVRKEPRARIAAYDRHPGAVTLARRDAAVAGLGGALVIETSAIQELKLDHQPRWVFANPPWGERLDADDVIESWRALGHFLKSSCPGATAWILSGDADLTRHLGLKSNSRHPLAIGGFDCRAIEYEVGSARAGS